MLTQKDVVTDTDIAISPCTSIFLEDLFEAGFISLSFICLRPIFASLIAGKLFFDIARQHKTVIHVGCLFKQDQPSNGSILSLGFDIPS